MEDKFVYMTPEQIEQRRAKIATIKGLAEIKAATDVDEKMRLRQKYPRAAAYLEAARCIATNTPIKVRLGSRAIEKILNGEDPETVLNEMNKGLDAFYMAQEG